MAKADVEKSSYGAFERFLFFATPIIFTVVLLGVLFALFDQSLMNGMLRTANKIPVLSQFVPDPAETPDRVNLLKPVDEASEMAALIEELRNTVKQQESALSQASSANESKDKSIKDLQDQLKAIQEQETVKTQSEEQYKLQVQQLANMFAKMSASKAAPILENMTLQERVLVLSEMNADNRGKVLEKMNPKLAADASIQLKDIVPAKDRQIAALQERLAVNQAEATATQQVSKEDLGTTFSSMDAKSASSILLEMNSINQAKVLAILSSMDSGGRSRVLAEMNKTNKQAAADLTIKLTQ